METLASHGLPPVTSVHTLSLLSGFSPRFVIAMAKNARHYYRTFYMLSGTKKRKIEAPRVSLKVIQKWLAEYWARGLVAPSHVHAFVPGRSIWSAAEEHKRSKWCVSVDIKDFFGSISRAQVYDSVVRVGYSSAASNLIADLATLNGVLPQGSPLSPVLSNMVFADTDKRLASVANEHGWRLTRYADDIVVTNWRGGPDGVLERVSRVLVAGGWKVATQKTVVESRPEMIRVLGLLVHGDQVRLPKAYRNRIRLMKYQRTKMKPGDVELARINGHISFANQADSIRR